MAHCWFCNCYGAANHKIMQSLRLFLYCFNCWCCVSKEKQNTTSHSDDLAVSGQRAFLVKWKKYYMKIYFILPNTIILPSITFPEFIFYSFHHTVLDIIVVILFLVIHVPVSWRTIDSSCVFKLGVIPRLAQSERCKTNGTLITIKSGKSYSGIWLLYSYKKQYCNPYFL